MVRLRFWCVIYLALLVVATPCNGQQQGAGQFSPFSTSALPTARQLAERPKAPEAGLNIAPNEITERYRDILIVRILSRQRRHEEAIAKVTVLQRKYPGDIEVENLFVETMVESGDLELAKPQIQKTLKKTPKNVRMRQLAAQLLLERGDYIGAYEIYQAILEETPGEIAVRTDLAYAALQNGDDMIALENFQIILEQDPTNDDAQIAARNILLVHRPSIDYATSIYQQPQSTITTTHTVEMEAPINKAARIRAGHTHVHVKRTFPDAEPVDRTISETSVTAEIKVNKQITVSPTITGYTMSNPKREDVSFGLEVRREIPNKGTLRLYGFQDRPWYDPIDAAEEGGLYRQVGIEYSRFFENDWGVDLRAEYLGYSIDSNYDYAHRFLYSGTLSRRIVRNPDLILSYNYYNSFAKYTSPTANPDDEIVPLVELEDIHTFSYFLSAQITDRWRFLHTAGYGWNTTRNEPNLFMSAGIEYLIHHRFTIRSNFNYQSDTNIVGGGESTNIDFGFRYVF